MTSDASHAESSVVSHEKLGTGPTWNVVLDYVVELLAAADDPDDFVLPGERELASTLGVGRQSVREALRALQILGILHQGVGSGPTAGTRFINDSSIGFYRILNLYGRTNAFPIQDLVDLRITLERASSSRLASKVLQGELPDLQEASSLLQLMESSVLDPTEFLHYDALFHVSLAKASENSINGNLMSGLRGAIESYFINQIPSNWPRTSMNLLREHHEILRLINEGEPELAAACVEAHITGYYESRL